MQNRDKVEMLANRISQYFLERDFRLYVSLFHRLTRRELFEMRKLHKERLGQQYIVTPYMIDAYSQPSWDIFDTHRFEPEPTHSIRLSLEFPEYGGVENLYFACAPASDDFKICNYVSRQQDGISRVVPDSFDLEDLHKELRLVISGEIQALGTRLGGQPVGFFRLDYSIEPHPCAVDLYAYLAELDERSWQESPHLGCEYRRSDLLADGYRAIIDGSPQLILTDGRRIDLAQEKFEEQFPEWVGEIRFKEQVKNCMVNTLTECLAEAHGRSVFAWKGSATAVVASYEELEDETAPLKNRDVIEGITFYEAHSLAGKA